MREEMLDRIGAREMDEIELADARPDAFHRRGLGDRRNLEHRQQQGGETRVFERGGRVISSQFPEVGIPNSSGRLQLLDEPGRPDIKQSNRGPGTGGRIAVQPSTKFRGDPAENIITGNVALYGAIAGEAYFEGVAASASRCAIRARPRSSKAPATMAANT